MSKQIHRTCVRMSADEYELLKKKVQPPNCLLTFG